MRSCRLIAAGRAGTLALWRRCDSLAIFRSSSTVKFIARLQAQVGDEPAGYRWYTRSASAWRPLRYRAFISR